MGSGSSRTGARRGSDIQGSGKAKLLLKTLGGHTGGINCMDISSSGDYLLTGSDDRTARVWDLVTHENKVVLEGHGGYISCCKIWRDRFALTGSMDKTIRKWNMLSGNCVLKMELHKGMVNRLLWQGRYLFSSSYDRTVICWNIENGQPCKVFRGHKQSVLPILYVKTADHDPQGVEDLERNKDALLTGSMDCTARIWSIHSGTSLRSFRGHKGAILCITIDKAKNYLYTGSTDFSIRKWNIANGSLLKTFKGHEGSVICLEINHKLLYSASVDCTARCWVAEFGDTTRKYSAHDHMISDMKFHSGLLITSSGDNTVRIFDAKSGSLKRTFKGHKYAVNCILAVDSTVFSASYDGTIKIWNIRDLIKEKLSVLASEDSSSSLNSSAISVTTNSQVSGSNVSVQGVISGRKRIKGHFPKQSDAENNIRLSTLAMEREDSNLNPTHRRRGVKQANRIAPMNSYNFNNNNDKAEDEVNMTSDSLKNGDADFNRNGDKESESKKSTDAVSCDGAKATQRHNYAKTPSSSSLISNARRAVPHPLSRGSSKASLFANAALIPEGDEKPMVGVRQDSLSNESGSGSMSLPSSSHSSRSTNGVHRRESSDVSQKRVKTDDNSSAVTAGESRISSEDLALVDEEIRMIAMETDSTSTGYHSDKSSPQSPNHLREKTFNYRSKLAHNRFKTAIPSPINERSTPRKESTRPSLWETFSNNTEGAEQNNKTKRITKAVGGTNKQPQASDRTRTTFSDAERERLEEEILKLA